MAFVNNFLVGADPEFVVMEPPAVINAQRLHPLTIRPKESFFGWDHNGFVVEPHPTPDISVRKVVQNIKRCLDGLSVPFGNQKWRAGAYIAGNGLNSGNNRRSIGLGGHVHLDFPEPSAAQIRAFDSIYATLINLEILPPEESTNRLEVTGYGRVGDVRFEHGHMEYRSLCSWLFSRKASMLCMTAIKLAAVDPKSCSKAFTSKVDFKNWFETFADKDDDAKWIIEKPYFEGDLVARPDRDMKSIWSVDPEKGKELYVEVEAETSLQRRQREINMAREAMRHMAPHQGQIISTNNPQDTLQQYYDTQQNLTGGIQRNAAQAMPQQGQFLPQAAQQMFGAAHNTLAGALGQPNPLATREILLAERDIARDRRDFLERRLAMDNLTATGRQIAQQDYRRAVSRIQAINLDLRRRGEAVAA